MSYCGACGGFYSPACARREQGVCAPAPNPHELNLVAILAAIEEANGRVAGMLADNAHAALHGQPPQWYSMDFGAAHAPVAAALAKAVNDAA